MTEMTVHWRGGLAMAGVLLLATPAGGQYAGGAYPWPHGAGRTLEAAVAPPRGFVRRPVAAGSFAAWLRQLPMKADGSPVRLHTGGLKWRQDVHAAVVDIDTGRRDLQQCADAVMRLRAEWLRAAGREREIGFDYTGGGRVDYARWADGWRPDAKGKRWAKKANADRSYEGFRKYLTNVFVYAGTYSLARELKPVKGGDVRVGDVFIKGGFPGHAVLVADMVEKPATGERRFILLQSYMPAQDIHVLKNPQAEDGSPWYPARFSWPLATPEWTFPMGALKRWER
ncbi:MAG: hypothetical protein RLZ98_926 [Pseudomonadota bacterium]|jgi:hypothetical protein